MKKLLLFLYLLCLVTLAAKPTYGWHENGHQLIALMAFDMLEPDDQEILTQLLRSHPNFEVDFAPPSTVDNPKKFRRWIIGRSGYWPDVARRYDEWNRPSWHYQLGATKTIGTSINVPKEAPFFAPPGADSRSQDLHVLEAIDLNAQILSDSRYPAPERAVAICWLFHLIADLHQPCHAGSLYLEGVFPEGDRGANQIKLIEGGNMHAVWDGLLGSEYDPQEIDRRIAKIYSNQRVTSAVAKTLARNNTDQPSDWMLESRAFGNRFVYTDSILKSVAEKNLGKSDGQPNIQLSSSYLENANLIAERQALMAAIRLKKMIGSALLQYQTLIDTSYE